MTCNVKRTMVLSNYQNCNWTKSVEWKLVERTIGVGRGPKRLQHEKVNEEHGSKLSAEMIGQTVIVQIDNKQRVYAATEFGPSYGGPCPRDMSSFATKSHIFQNDLLYEGRNMSVVTSKETAPAIPLCTRVRMHIQIDHIGPFVF